MQSPAASSRDVVICEGVHDRDETPGVRGPADRDGIARRLIADARRDGRSLVSGEDCPEKSEGTLGELPQNQGREQLHSEDAAVILSNSAVETPDRLFYVRAGMEAKITEIPPGRYRVMFQTGKKWDSESEIFQCVLATKIFDRGEAFPSVPI
jgi:hypothetical protein